MPPSPDPSCATPPRPLAGPAPVRAGVNLHPSVVAAHRRGSLVSAVPALLGALATPVYLAYYGLALRDVVLFGVFYFLTMGVGLCVGFHRHFSHRAFHAARPLRWSMAVLGSMGGQGALAYWVAVHRRHHEFSDEEGDPHSPNLHGQGLGGTLRGLWHGHFGWSLAYGIPSSVRYCPDILREPYLMRVSRQYNAWFLVGLLLPALAGGLWGGTWSAALGGLLIAGFLRVFVSSNSTWSLNSICHCQHFGSRPHVTRDLSRNVGWLALFTLGESWHNNHHAHPSAAAHGRRWWQLDLNYVFIWTMERLGLAWNVNRVDP